MRCKHFRENGSFSVLLPQLEKPMWIVFAIAVSNAYVEWIFRVMKKTQEKTGCIVAVRIALEYIIENACKDDLEGTKDMTDQQWKYSRKCEATKLQSQINHCVYLPHQCSLFKNAYTEKSQENLLKDLTLTCNRSSVEPPNIRKNIVWIRTNAFSQTAHGAFLLTTHRSQLHTASALIACHNSCAVALKQGLVERVHLFASSHTVQPRQIDLHQLGSEWHAYFQKKVRVS